MMNVENGWTIVPVVDSGTKKWLLTMSGQTGISCSSGGKFGIDWINEDSNLDLNWRSPIFHVAGQPIVLGNKETIPFFVPEQWTILVTLNKTSTNYSQFLIHSWDIDLNNIPDFDTAKEYKAFNGIKVRVSHIGGDGSRQDANVGFHVTLFGRIVKITCFRIS